MTEKEKLHSGDIYQPGDPDIMAEQVLCQEKLYDFNQTRPLELEKRTAMLQDMFAQIGEGCYIEPRFMPILADTMSISASGSMPITI